MIKSKTKQPVFVFFATIKCTIMVPASSKLLTLSYLVDNNVYDNKLHFIDISEGRCSQ